MRTQTYLRVKEIRKDIPIMPPDLALWLTLIRSNYPCLENIFMVPKVFELLEFYCIFISGAQSVVLVCRKKTQIMRTHQIFFCVFFWE